MSRQYIEELMNLLESLMNRVGPLPFNYSPSALIEPGPNGDNLTLTVFARTSLPELIAHLRDAYALIDTVTAARKTLGLRYA